MNFDHVLIGNGRLRDAEPTIADENLISNGTGGGR